MNNYYYIVAGLPDISPGGENKIFSYEAVRDEIYKQCSDIDKALIELMEKGFDENNLNVSFYSEVFSSKCLFIVRYYKMDLLIRNKKVSYLASRLFADDAAKGKELAAKYSVSMSEDSECSYNENDTEVSFDASDIQKLNSIFEDHDILGKEKKLDDFKWLKINEFTAFDFFDIDIILSFLAKGKLVDRWNKLDEEKGKVLFKKLVDEVRGTFKGLNDNTIKKQ